MEAGMNAGISGTLFSINSASFRIFEKLEWYEDTQNGIRRVSNKNMQTPKDQVSAAYKMALLCKQP